MRFFVVVVVLLNMSSAFSVENVIEDNDMGVQKEEVIAIIKTLHPNTVRKMGRDEVFRNDIMLKLLMNKKTAKKLDILSANFDDEDKWDLEIAIQNVKSRLYMKYFLKNIKYPNFEKLAKELYHVDTEKYAGVDEKRLAAQILIKCSVKKCEEESRKLADKVEKELAAGTSFEDLVTKYSEDELTKTNGGLIRPAVSEGDESIDINFRKQLFKIEKIGRVSEKFKTRFGYHILKLVKVDKAYVKDYSEVKNKIIKGLKEKYKQLSVKALNRKFINVNNVKFNVMLWESVLEKWTLEQKGIGHDKK